MRSLTLRSVLTLLAASLLPLLTAVGWSLHQTTLRMSEELAGEFGHLARLKQGEMTAELRALMADAAALANHPDVITILDDAGHQRPEAWRSAYNAVQAWQEARWGRVHHVFLARLGGEVLLSPERARTRAQIEGEEAWGWPMSGHRGHRVETDYWQRGLEAPTITDFFGFVEKDHFHQLLLHPVQAADQVRGVLIIEISIEETLELLARDLPADHDARVTLLTEDSQRIQHARGEGTPKLKRDGVDALLADPTLGLTHGHFRDEAGEGWYGVYLHDPEWPWVIAIEAPSDVLFAPVQRQLWRGVVLSTIVLLLIAPLAVWLGRRTTRPILEAQAIADRIAAGELGVEGDREGRARADELGALHRALENMRETLITNDEAQRRYTARLDEIFAQTRAVVEELESGSKDLAAASKTMAAGANEQTTAIERITHSAGAARGACEAQGQDATRAGEAAEVASTNATRGHAHILTMRASMQRIEETSDQVASIISLIDGIAEQTNVLAINASIEAARAGEAGKGFAVVAKEVRALAQRSSKAAHQTGALIHQVIGEVAEGAEASVESEAILDEINASMASLSESITVFVEAATHQAEAIVQITDQLERIDEVTRTNAVSAEQVAGAAEGLAAQTAQLRALVAEGA